MGERRHRFIAEGRRELPNYEKERLRAAAAEAPNE
jgi:hypothetical protein